MAEQATSNRQPPTRTLIREAEGLARRLRIASKGELDLTVITGGPMTLSWEAAEELANTGPRVPST